jgi:hypothetical protein
MLYSKYRVILKNQCHFCNLLQFLNLSSVLLFPYFVLSEKYTHFSAFISVELLRLINIYEDISVQSRKWLEFLVVWVMWGKCMFIQFYLNKLFMHRAHPSEGGDGSSVVRETWFLLLIGGTVLTLVLGFIGLLYLRRRQALGKELGHLNGTCNPVDMGPFCSVFDLRVGGCVGEL